MTNNITQTIAVTSEHMAIVRAILSAHLPPSAKIHVFGSRAKGTPRLYSDLDLPWKVDIIDRQCTGEDFLRIIETDCIALDWVSR